MKQNNVGDSVRAGCGDKPHVRFGRGGLVLLSNQDLAFYLTSNDRGNARYTGKGNRVMRMSAIVRWRPRTARGEAVKADYVSDLESRMH